jgi:hypothetical protein
MDLKRWSISLILFVFLIIPALAAAVTPTPDTGKTVWSFAYFGETEENYFHQPSDIEADAAKSLIYVVDSGNHRIVAVDFDGRFVRIIGKEGQGPGEFSRPSGVFVCPDSRLAVADYGNNRIQVFDETGKFLSTTNTKEVRVADLMVIEDLFYTIPTFGSSGFNINMGSDADSQPLVVVLDTKGDVVREITISDFPETQPFVRALKHRVSLSRSPDGRLFLPFGNMNVIQVFDLEGSKLTQFDRPLPFKPMVPQLRSLKSGTQGQSKVVQMSARTDQVSRAALFGPDGLFYVLTYSVSMDEWMKQFKDPREQTPMPMHIDVIDPNTLKPVRTLAVDPGCRAFGILAAGRIVYIHQDEEGELVLKCIQY